MSLKRIGKIVNIFGLEGDLKIISTSNSTLDRFKVGKKVYISNEEYEIDRVRMKPGCIILHLVNLIDPNISEKFIGKDIMQDIKLKKGEFFLDDVIGFEVFSKDKLLGKILDYREINDLIYFDVDGKLIPYIKKTFIERMDFDNKIMYVTQLGEETLL